MAERKAAGRPGEEEEVPAFFKNLGSGSPKPRQKFCGMFCPVEGSLENKTIDFDSLSVGRGSGKVVAQQRDVAQLGPDPRGRAAGQRGPSVELGRKVEIRAASGKEALQNLGDKKRFPRALPHVAAAPPISSTRLPHTRTTRKSIRGDSPKDQIPADLLQGTALKAASAPCPTLRELPPVRISGLGPLTSMGMKLQRDCRDLGLGFSGK